VNIVSNWDAFSASSCKLQPFWRNERQYYKQYAVKKLFTLYYNSKPTRPCVSPLQPPKFVQTNLLRVLLIPVFVCVSDSRK
ncbi:MAG: hypothetical protein RR593_07765, partial [Hungatella sp.]